MDIITHNKYSFLGMIFGAIALLLGIFHFSFGPFSEPSATLETVVAEKVHAVKKGIIAGLKGESPAPVVESNTLDIDKVLTSGGIALAVIALVCAFTGGIRKENRWSINGALLFGGGTLAFHALLWSMGIIFAIILLILIFSFLSGNLFT